MSGKCGLKRRNMGKSLGAYLGRAAGVRKMCSQIAKDGTKSLGANPGRAAGVREGGVKWRKKGENPSRPIWGGRRVYGNVLSNGEIWQKISRGQSGEAGGCPESVLPNGDLCEKISVGQFGESDACPGMCSRMTKNGTKSGEGGGCPENVFSIGEKWAKFSYG